jgi:hypothetical protein
VKSAVVDKSEQESSLTDEEELPISSVEQELCALYVEQSTDWASSRPSPEQVVLKIDIIKMYLKCYDEDRFSLKLG